MLVLTRKVGEAIKIGDNITVVLVEIQNGQVRLGIQAPEEIPVHRLEIYNAIKRGERGEG
jgi:carbon storage regulator